MTETAKEKGDTLGNLAVKLGYVSESDLQSCLEDQRQAQGRGETVLLGQVLLKRRLISTAQLAEMLRRQVITEEKTQTFGRYVLLKLLGEGGMGEVWLARDSILKREVALKILTRASRKDIDRFSREAELAAQLTHPNLVQIYETGEVNGRHFISMQHVEGSSLDRQKLTPERALQVMRSIAGAVHYAHMRGIIHRDIKPGNILLGKDSEVFLSDFGLAKGLESEGTVSVAGTIIGTPAFMPPEMARGDHKETDALSDVYCLGATLYALLTGEPPFESASLATTLDAVINFDPAPLKKLDKNLPSEIEIIVQRAMQKDKAHRYPSAKDFAEDIDRYLTGEPIHARRSTIVYRTQKWVRRNRSLVAGIVGSTLLAAALGALAWMIYRNAQFRDANERLNSATAQIAQYLKEINEPFRETPNDDGPLHAARKLAREAREYHFPEIDARALLLEARALRHLDRSEEALKSLDALCSRPDAAGEHFYERALVRVEIFLDHYLTHMGEMDSRVVTELLPRIDRDMEQANRLEGIGKPEKVLAEAMRFFCTSRYENVEKLYVEKNEDVRLITEHLALLRAISQYILSPLNLHLIDERFREATEFGRRNPKLYAYAALMAFNTKRGLPKPGKDPLTYAAYADGALEKSHVLRPDNWRARFCLYSFVVNEAIRQAMKDPDHPEQKNRYDWCGSQFEALRAVKGDFPPLFNLQGQLLCRTAQERIRRLRPKLAGTAPDSKERILFEAELKRTRELWDRGFALLKSSARPERDYQAGQSTYLQHFHITSSQILDDPVERKKLAAGTEKELEERVASGIKSRSAWGFCYAWIYLAYDANPGGSPELKHIHRARETMMKLREDNPTDGGPSRALGCLEYILSKHAPDEPARKTHLQDGLRYLLESLEKNPGMVRSGPYLLDRALIRFHLGSFREALEDITAFNTPDFEFMWLNNFDEICPWIRDGEIQHMYEDCKKRVGK